MTADRELPNESFVRSYKVLSNIIKVEIIFHCFKFLGRTILSRDSIR